MNRLRRVLPLGAAASAAVPGLAAPTLTVSPVTGEDEGGGLFD